VPGSDLRNKSIFAASLCLLIIWAVVLGFIAAGGGDAQRTDRPASVASTHSPSPGAARIPGQPGRSKVADSALEFTDAYLGYQVGELGHSDRRALVRLSTPLLRAQLLQAPPRAPATGAPLREWASRVEAIHVGIYGGSPALLAEVLVLGVNGAHVLTPTFVKSGSRWLVAGIGA
jgi:hypothetical protein